jgi:hypothetical protein
MQLKLFFFWIRLPTLIMPWDPISYKMDTKFLTNLYQKQMNQFTQMIQFWIVNAMVNSSVNAYYIMLITFSFIKYFVIFSHFSYHFYIFGIQMSNYVSILLSMHRTVFICAMEIVSKFKALLSIRF